jgi:hypothetical protein
MGLVRKRNVGERATSGEIAELFSITQKCKSVKGSSNRRLKTETNGHTAPLGHMPYTPTVPIPSNPHSTRASNSLHSRPKLAPVAQLDRVFASEAKGHRFESCRAYQFQLERRFKCGECLPTRAPDRKVSR